MPYFWTKIAFEKRGGLEDTVTVEEDIGTVDNAVNVDDFHLILNDSIVEDLLGVNDTVNIDEINVSENCGEEIKESNLNCSE